MNTCSALALLIPTRLTHDIEYIRKEHDKAYDRWMPHINLLFPFVHNDKIPDITERLNRELSKIPSFVLNLNEIGFFPQKDSNTYHLKPRDESEMINLYNAIRAAIPELKMKNNNFHPHLTLGQWKKSENPKDFLENMFTNGIIIVVDKIHIITRNKDDHFTIHTEIPLGSNFEGGYED